MAHLVHSPLCLSLRVNFTNSQLLVKVVCEFFFSFRGLSTETQALETSHFEVKSVGVTYEFFGGRLLMSDHFLPGLLRSQMVKKHKWLKHKAVLE